MEEIAKTILLVHGRHFKPSKDDLRKLWIEALRYGIERDHPGKLAAFKQARIEFVYYGDISNKFLIQTYGTSPPNDLRDRQDCLTRLKAYKGNQFTKANYKKLPGYNPWMERFADLFAGALSMVRMSDFMIEKVAPDVGEYWQSYRFGSDVREVFTTALIKAMKKTGDLCVISHSLGTMIAYDVFWKLSHYSEYRGENWNRKISLWLTLGSPLGDETVKRHLKGANHAKEFRYPTNVVDWLNFAAEDDYISHDEKVANDFRAMKQQGFIKSIKDRRIYNLSLRTSDGKLQSNPHHGTGYLINPKVASAVANWL